MFMKRYLGMGLSQERAEEETMKDIVNDFEQGFQGWEYKFNTVASSRGDYPFITMTLGLGQTRMAKLASKLFLKVHAGGQGKKNNKKPVLFPKLVFLYDENLHGPGKPLEDVFEEMLGSEIMDESDSVADLRQMARQRRQALRAAGLLEQQKKEEQAEQSRS